MGWSYRLIKQAASAELPVAKRDQKIWKRARRAIIRRKERDPSAGSWQAATRGSPRSFGDEKLVASG
jgi:hypothetical protein